MALSIKWKYNGEEVDAICRVYAVNINKGNWKSVLGRTGMSSISSSGEEDRSFYYTAYYRICRAEDESIVLSSGETNIAYDLESENNILVVAYKQIKDFPEFVDSQDI